MNKRTKNTINLLISAVIIIIAAGSALSYIALTKEYDTAIFHFVRGSFAGPASMILPWLSVVAGIAAMIVCAKKVSISGLPSAGAFTVFSSVLTGLLMLSSAFFTISGERHLTRLIIITAAVSALSGLYFIIMPFISGKPVAVAMSYVPAIWAAVSLLSEYFREGEPINSPVRISNLAMYAFIMIFFTEDIRFGAGTQIPGTYLFCSFCALTFTGCAVFPKLAIIYSRIDLFDFYLIDCFLCAAIFLFILSRIISFPSAACQYTPKMNKKNGDHSADECNEAYEAEKNIATPDSVPETANAASAADSVNSTNDADSADNANGANSANNADGTNDADSVDVANSASANGADGANSANVADSADGANGSDPVKSDLTEKDGDNE